MANENIQELKFQVGEAWKGVYSSSTAYGLANVVQDPTGLSIYRSLKSGNVGHPLSNASWWFRIIDLSSIKAESDRIAALNQAIAQDEALRVAAEELRQQHEAERVAAETQRNEAEQQRISAEQARVNAESARATAEQQRITAEEGRVSAESARVTAEQARVLAETLRANAEDQRAANEQNRIAAEQQRIERAEQDHQRAESDHAAYVDSLGAFDISSYHATDGVLAKYADLTAALGTNGANIPDGLRKGGMSVKFVQSSDNKYVQARCMAQNFTTDTTQWQVVDDEIKLGSKNIATCGGVANAISPINHKIGGTSEDLYVEKKLGYVKYDDGTISPTEGYFHSQPIPLKKGETITYIGLSYTTSNAISLYNNGTYSRCVRGTGVEGDTYTYTAIKDCQVVISGYATYFVSASTIIPDHLQEIRNSIVALAESTTEEFNSINEKLGGQEVGQTITKNEGSYINRDGQIVPNEPSFYSNPITLHKGDKLEWEGLAYPSTSAIALYNNGTYTRLVAGTGVEHGQIYEYTAIADCQIVISGYSSYYVQTSITYFDKLKDFEDRIEVLEEESEIKKWTGKKWACMGDSLTANNEYTTKHYFDYVAEDTGITPVNLGVSGTGYLQGHSLNMAFFDRVSSIPNDTDVLTIFGSFNDLAAGEVGDVADSGTTTICGAINTTLDAIFTAFPLIKIGVVSPTPWAAVTPRPGDTGASAIKGRDYVEKLATICKNRGIPFYNLFYCSNLRPWSTAFKELAYTKDIAGGVIAGVHPDETGHELIAPRFEAFLKTLLLC